MIQLNFEIDDAHIGYSASRDDRGQHLPEGRVNEKRCWIFFSESSEGHNLAELAEFCKAAREGRQGNSLAKLHIPFNVLDLVAYLRDLHCLSVNSGLVDLDGKPEFEALRADLAEAIAQIDAIKWSPPST